MSTAVLSETAALRLRGGVFTAALLLVWVSTNPFQPRLGEEVAASGNIVNQIAFSSMALIALGSLALIDRRALLAYVTPVYGLMLAWLMVSVAVSANPDVSLRAFLFMLTVLIIAGCAMVMPQSERQFATLIGAAALIVLLICYAGLAAFPGVAIHSEGDALEPEHAGAWRGLFDHKNIAGAMMAVFLMIGIYVAGARSLALGLTIAGLAAVFLFSTGSKTSMALGPAVLVLTSVAAWFRSTLVRALLILGPLLIALSMTVGTVLSPTLKTVLDGISPGQTFTGRTEIWDFAIDRIWERLYTGHGLEGFWGSDRVRFAEIDEGQTGIAQGMVHAHNSYVDAIVSMGLPGFAIVILTLVLLPFWDWMRAAHAPSNERMALLFARIWLFALYNACLETFFFRRADPVWFALLIAILGLRLVATWRIREA